MDKCNGIKVGDKCVPFRNDAQKSRYEKSGAMDEALDNITKGKTDKLKKPIISITQKPEAPKKGTITLTEKKPVKVPASKREALIA